MGKVHWALPAYPLTFAHRRSDRHADQQPLRADEACHHLAPGFSPGAHEQPVATFFQLLAGHLDGVDVELEPGVWGDDVRRPGGRAEARLSGLAERPYREGLRPFDF